MDFELPEEHRMLRDLVRKFVDDELVSKETMILEREASGKGSGFSKEETARLDDRARELGLQGLDAPAEFGGSDMPVLQRVPLPAGLSEPADAQHCRQQGTA